MNIFKSVSMSAYYQIRRISKAFKNWKKFGVIMFGSLFLASNVAGLPAIAYAASSATYEVYIDTNGSGAMTVGQSRTFTAQAVMGFGAGSDVTSSSKFNWLAINKATGQTVDTKTQVGSSYVFTPTEAGDYQIRAKGSLTSDASKNAWEKFAAYVKVNAANGGDDDNGGGTGGDDNTDNNSGGTTNALYEVYIDTNWSNAMNIGDTRTYHAQALLGFGPNSDVTTKSHFNWLAINLDTNSIVDTKQNVGSSYVFEAKAAGHYQIRARGYLNSDASKNAWEKFPAFVNVNGTTVTCPDIWITVNPSTTPLTMVNGVATATLTLHIEDSLGNSVTPTNPIWDVVNGGATITATSATTATFTTSLPNTDGYHVRVRGFACGSPFALVKVLKVVDNEQSLRVQITPVMPSVLAGSSVTYTATAYDEHNNPINSNQVNFSWHLKNAGPSIGVLQNNTGKDVVFKTNTGIDATYQEIIEVEAKRGQLSATDDEGIDIYQVTTQQVIDHVTMTVDRNPINTNDSTLVRAQAYDQFGVAIPNCAYNWNQLSGVGSITSATNIQVITFSSQTLTGSADLKVTANCFGAERFTTGTVSVVGAANNFHVELTPDIATVLPHSQVLFTARAYSGNTEVTNSTVFSFSKTMGDIVSQSANTVWLNVGANLGTFPAAISVTGVYQSMTDADASTVVVQQDAVTYDINGSIVGSLDGKGTNACTDDVITYTVTISNFQNNNLTNVYAKMSIPANTTFMSATSGTGSVEVIGDVIKWTIGSLGYGQSRVMTVKVMAKSGLVGTKAVNAAVTVTADQLNGVIKTFNANQINLVCGGGDGKGPLPSTGVEWQMLVALLAGALGLTTVTYLLLRRKDATVTLN